MKRKKKSAEKKTNAPESREAEKLPGDLITGATAWPHERNCPVCGKHFSFPIMEDWVYRNKGQILCSWGCVRKREKEQEDEERRRREARRMLTPKQRETMVKRLACQGLTDEEIALRLQMHRQHVHYYRKKIEEEWEE